MSAQQTIYPDPVRTPEDAAFFLLVELIRADKVHKSPHNSNSVADNAIEEFSKLLAHFKSMKQR